MEGDKERGGKGKGGKGKLGRDADAEYNQVSDCDAARIKRKSVER